MSEDVQLSASQLEELKKFASEAEKLLLARTEFTDHVKSIDEDIKDLSTVIVSNHGIDKETVSNVLKHLKNAETTEKAKKLVDIVDTLGL